MIETEFGIELVSHLSLSLPLCAAFWFGCLGSFFLLLSQCVGFWYRCWCTKNNQRKCEGELFLFLIGDSVTINLHVLWFGSLLFYVYLNIECENHQVLWKSVHYFDFFLDGKTSRINAKRSKIWMKNSKEKENKMELFQFVFVPSLWHRFLFSFFLVNYMKKIIFFNSRYSIIFAQIIFV